MQKTQRNDTIDIVKAIGIFFMVTIHARFPFMYFSCLFSMSVFFMVSGYCFKDKNSASLKETAGFVKRKIITLWFPFVLWTAVFVLLHNFFIRINVYTDNPLLLEYVQGTYVSTTMPLSLADRINIIIKSAYFQGWTQVGGAFWFLATLFEVSVIYCIISLMLNAVFRGNSKISFIAQWIISVILLLTGYFCYIKENTIYGIERAFSCYILFHSGYTIKRNEWLVKKGKKYTHAITLICSFVILVICNSIGEISLDANSYENPLFLMVVSFAGWFFVYELACLAVRADRLKRILVCIGQNTLAVVILHFLCFKLVSYIGVLLLDQPLFLVAAFPVLYRGGGWCVLYWLAGIAIPVGLSLLWKKIRALVKA